MENEKDMSLIGSDVLKVEAAALITLANSLGGPFNDAVDLLSHVLGRVIVSGMGKSGHIARKIAATLSSTGTPAQFVHPGEASHGDLGMITGSDVCIIVSNSGETLELADEIIHCNRFNIPIIAITKNSGSTLADAAQIVLLLPNAPEACGIGMAPTTSTTMSIALGDALAVALMKRHDFDRDSFIVNHPSGKLGTKFLKVERIMHAGSSFPAVSHRAQMSDVLLEMTTKGLGVTAVLTGAKVFGIITDGDLRRNIDGVMKLKAGDVATKKPITIGPEILATEALAIMNDNGISSLIVVDSSKTPIGMIHIQDMSKAGVI